MSSPTVSSNASSLGGAWDVEAFTSDVPDRVWAAVAAADQQKRITKKDPLIIIELNDPALLARQAAVPGVNVSKATVAAIITAHMAEVPDLVGAPSGLIFRGTHIQSLNAINALCGTPWVRPMPGLPDLGKTWHAASVAAVGALAPPFNA